MSGQDVPVFDVATPISTKDRVTSGHLVAETIAIPRLVALVATTDTGSTALPAPTVGGCCIDAAHWFTGSTSFAVSAVTIGRHPLTP